MVIDIREVKNILVEFMFGVVLVLNMVFLILEIRKKNGKDIIEQLEIIFGKNIRLLIWIWLKEGKCIYGIGNSFLLFFIFKY